MMRLRPRRPMSLSASWGTVIAPWMSLSQRRVIPPISHLAVLITQPAIQPPAISSTMGFPIFNLLRRPTSDSNNETSLPLFPDNPVYGGPSANVAEYDPMMTSLLSLSQQASASVLSGSGAGSSPPPSMIGSGSLTSRSSSRASVAAFDFYDMTAADAGYAGDGSRLPRQCNASVAFPVTGPFESESTTAIPSFESFDRPLQNRPSPLDVDSRSCLILPTCATMGMVLSSRRGLITQQQQQLSSSPISSHKPQLCWFNIVRRRWLRIWERWHCRH
jgi:hypothetical protein